MVCKRLIFALLLGGLATWAAPPQAAKKSAPAAPSAKKAGAPSSAAEKSGLNKQHLEAYVRHVFAWVPQVKVEIADFTPSPVPGLLQTKVRASYGPASEEKTFYLSADGKYIMDGNLYTAADNPFRSNLNKITTALQPSFGAAGAPVVLVSYSDFQCPHCREEAKALRENITKTFPTQVRVYYKDYPLPNHDWAKTASIAGRCIFRQNPLAFWDFHDWVFDKQTEITSAGFIEKLNGFIKGKEIDPLQLNRCVEKGETEAEVNKSMAEAKALGVSSTPTLFVNGRKLVGSVAWPNLKQIIEMEIDYQKTAKNAGEQECCEVRLPSPLSNP